MRLVNIYHTFTRKTPWFWEPHALPQHSPHICENPFVIITKHSTAQRGSLSLSLALLLPLPPPLVVACLVALHCPGGYVVWKRESNRRRGGQSRNNKKVLGFLGLRWNGVFGNAAWQIWIRRAIVTFLFYTSLGSWMAGLRSMHMGPYTHGHKCAETIGTQIGTKSLHLRTVSFSW